MSHMERALADAPPTMRMAELERRLGVSAIAIKAMVKRGDLPEPYRMGPRTFMFDRDEVIEAVKKMRGIDRG